MSLKGGVIVLAVVGVSVGLLVILGQFFYSQEPTLEKKASQQLVIENPEETEEFLQAISVNESSETAEDVPVESRLLLSEDCPEILDLSVATNQECMEAVEMHFLDRATYTVEFVGMIPKDGPYTFRMTFDSVETDRKLVVEALSRPTCQLLNGPIRFELREMCNADAIFRFLRFHEMCGGCQKLEHEFRTQFIRP